MWNWKESSVILFCWGQSCALFLWGKWGQLRFSAWRLGIMWDLILTAVDGCLFLSFSLTSSFISRAPLSHTQMHTLSCNKAANRPVDSQSDIIWRLMWTLFKGLTWNLKLHWNCTPWNMLISQKRAGIILWCGYASSNNSILCCSTFSKEKAAAAPVTWKYLVVYVKCSQLHITGIQNHNTAWHMLRFSTWWNLFWFGWRGRDGVCCVMLAKTTADWIPGQWG